MSESRAINSLERECIELAPGLTAELHGPVYLAKYDPDTSENDDSTTARPQADTTSFIRNLWSLRAPLNGRVLRMRIGEGLTSDWHILDQDFYLAINRVSAKNEEIESAPKDLHVEYTFSDFCALRVRLEGELHETLTDVGSHSLSANCSFLNFGRGLHYSLNTPLGTSLTSVTLIFKPKQLLRKLGARTQDTFAPLLEAGEATEAAAHLISLPVDVSLYRIAKELVDLPLEDPICELLAEAKAIQLLHTALSVQRKSNASTGVRLRKHDINQLSAVRQRLEEQCADSPTLEELSRWAGLNRRKLTEGFKALFGTTVNEYLQSHRMSLAARLLRQGLPVNQVSERVGYQDRGSFSKVFKRSFGVSPREYTSI